MTTFVPILSRLAEWSKKRTEGTRIFQWINYFMIFSVLLAFIIRYEGGTDWRFYTVVLSLAGLLVFNILWFQYCDRLAASPNFTIYRWGFITLTNLLVLVTFALTGREEVVFLILMQVTMFSSSFGIWPVGIMAAVLNLAATVAIIKGLGASNSDVIQYALQISVGMLFVMVVVLLMKRAQEQTRRAEGLLQDLRAVNLQLKTAHQKEKELAIAEERMRLARDIHDGLGHHLTVLSVQLQAAEKLVERSPQSAAEAIRISRAETQAALDEVRQSVGVMRQSPAESRPLPELLSGLVQDFGQHTGLQAAFEPSGSPLELSPFARQTLFRIAQEGLTNAQKHGQGVTRIAVRLEFTSEAVSLVVQDDGRADSPAQAEKPGFGLIGLRERLEELGGSLHSGPRPTGGFELAAHIPLQETNGDRRTAS
jgi:signal transduction histidine kinase